MTAADRIAELKAERDRARALAVGLEQQLARVEALSAKWDADLDALHPEQRTGAEFVIWACSAAELRDALNPQAGQL